MILRHLLPAVLLALTGEVLAVGLGDLRGEPSLGDQLHLQVEILGAEKQSIDAACFQLVRPSGTEELPWLKKAALSVRKGRPQTLEIRSASPLREPILQIGVYLGCGHEIVREYTLLASPAREGAAPASIGQGVERPVAAAPRSAERPSRPRAEPLSLPDERANLATRRVERRPAPARLSDRLMLSGGGEAGDPSLRLATELSSPTLAKEAERDILRLEYRMLMLLNEQATTQLAAAEKLRRMETTLGELQQRASEFAERVEKDAVPTVAVAPQREVPPVEASAPLAPPVKVPPLASSKPKEGMSEWSIYGLLLGVALGLAGWLGWRNYRQGQATTGGDSYPIRSPAIAVDPPRESERAERVVDLRLDDARAVTATPTRVDVELEGGDLEAHAHAAPATSSAPLNQDSVMAIGATSLDEHFEANPVMELADIMLSFGRVKGAAQALQEFIDNNPQEALQPWIRLMEVYRMAGMRNEFETVARNLNQHFNVEIQHWEAPPAPSIELVDESIPPPLGPRPESLEDMPRIMNMVCEQWATGDVVGYLYQLLRDNRGGKRAGFALPVVEEILFLIELKETSNRFE